MKQKLTSRKFLTALTGLITGIILIIAGDVTEGATTVVSAVVAYCIAEGYVDGKKLGNEFKNNEQPKQNN
ncbi:MAG: hypothetical protein IJZ20_06280 [Clostridia bacterium]|nr:hypothetical protein [Clostridia bacterium]MBQ8759282.1 hypothetical protein [Clostridia bacterium]